MAQHSITNRKLHTSWIRKQIFSKWHMLALLVFGILSVSDLAVVLGTILGITVIAGLIKIPSMLITAAILSAVTVIFPMLAGILSIVFFIMKAGYIIMHWRPLVIGAGLIAHLVFSAESRYFGYEMLFHSPQFVVQTLIGIGIFHLLLGYLYRKEYSAKEAVSIIATVPLFLFMLILPFLLRQLEEMGDVLEGSSYDAFEEDYYYQNNTNGSPGTHWVDGHYRETSGGGVTHVKGHFRTNPDGIEHNNLSSRK